MSLFFYQGIEELIVQEIEAFGFEQNTIISSFDHHALQKVQALQPRLKLGVLFYDHLLEPWSYVKQSGLNAYSIHPLFTFVNETFVQKCHAEGYQVIPYTVDERWIFERLCEMGIDGVFTNRPKSFI